MDSVCRMGFVRSIFAVLLLGLLAQNALACSEPEAAAAQPPIATAASDIAQLAANGSIGEERPACECPCPAGLSAPASASSATKALILSRDNCASVSPNFSDASLLGLAAHPRASSFVPRRLEQPRYFLSSRLRQ